MYTIKNTQQEIYREAESMQSTQTMTLSEVKALIDSRSPAQWPDILASIQDDGRAGVRRLYESLARKIAAYEAECRRLEQISVYENECYQDGLQIVAGIDEVGRGPLAGPVMACALILPKGCKISGVDD